jgi:hypothetical protein
MSKKDPAIGSDETESVAAEAKADDRYKKLKLGDGVYLSDQEANDDTNDDSDTMLDKMWEACQAKDKDSFKTAAREYMGEK